VVAQKHDLARSLRNPLKRPGIDDLVILNHNARPGGYPAMNNGVDWFLL
jgi:hypothetical protein